jgi:tetratricopeptide (TPR) repeat protein
MGCEPIFRPGVSVRRSSRPTPGRLAVAVLIALASANEPALAAGGGGGSYGGSVGDASSRRSSRSPEAVADRRHRTGLRYKQSAWKLEEKAAKKTEPEDREALLAKAKKAYEKAIVAQTAALEAFPKHAPAANELGYALRKTGQYEKAIAAYDRALTIDGVYYPAVEYRAEAYLGTGQLDEARRDYMILFRNDRKLASQLMTAMEAWLASQPDGEATAEFAEWLERRKALADVDQDLSRNNLRAW